MLRIGYRLAAATALLASAAFAEPRVISEYRNYNLRLISWRPLDTKVSGLLVPVRINQSRPLRLLLDTGATGIVLSKQAARTLQLEPASAESLTGFGTATPRTVPVTLAQTIEIGDLTLTNCEVRVLPEIPARDADGIIGLDVFEEFRIHLDAATRTLRLEAFPQRQTAEPAAHDHLLFVHARVNGKTDGLFLIDTGSALTSLASDLPWPAAVIGGETSLNSASGPVAAKRLAPISLEIAGQKLVEREPVALNLESVSRLNGIKVAGILGYSLLSRAPVTVSYRDRLVQLGHR